MMSLVKKKSSASLFVVFVLSSFFLGCANIFTEFGDRTSDNAIVKDIKILMDEKDYAAALEKFDDLSTSFKTEREALLLLSQINAGLCGLDFLAMSEDLAGLASSTLFEMLMGAFPGATATTVQYCIDAEAAILEISSDGSTRTTAENLTMAYVSWAKMGNILSFNADSDDDGSTDAGFDACAVDDLDSTSAKHMATGLANMLDGLANMGSGDVGSDQLSSVSTLCTFIEANLGAGYNFCSFKEISGITADMEKGMRSVVQENRDLGIGGGSCPDGSGMDDDPLNCVCP